MWSENEPAVKLGGWEKRRGESDETLHLRGREKKTKGNESHFRDEPGNTNQNCDLSRVALKIPIVQLSTNAGKPLWVHRLSCLDSDSTFSFFICGLVASL